MRKLAVFVVLSFLLFGFSSCTVYREAGSNFSDMRDSSTSQETELATQYMDSIVNAIETKNVQLMRSLFASNIGQKNGVLDEEILALFQFCKGKVIQCSGVVGEISTERVKGDVKKHVHASYNISTSEGAYRIAFKFCMKDSSDSDNEGLMSMYVVSQSESDMHFTYWGDYNWNDGVVIQG